MSEQISRERLRPDAASEYLLEYWAIRASASTLAKYRMLGEPHSPRFYVAGRDVSYTRADLDQWARGRLSKNSFGSTAEKRRTTATAAA